MKKSTSIFIYFLAIGLLTVLIGCNTSAETQNLFDKERQEQSDRNILGEITLQDSINLYNTYGIYSARILINDEEYLYISDGVEVNEVSVIDLENLEKVNTITVPQGRGPGEMVNIGNITFNALGIYIFSEEQMKVQEWDTSGEFVDEFILENSKPHRMVAWNDGSMTILSPMSPELEYIFHTKDNEGNLLHSFGAIPEEEFNFLQFAGELFNDDEYLYYAGYSEHILQKWDREGNQHYSIATIEDFPSELNYAVMESEDQRSVSYLETGNFSAKGATIYEDYLIILHAGIWGEPSSEFLDIYNKEDGKYLASFEIPHSFGNGHISIIDDHIYALHSIDDERHLGVYENFLKDLDSKM